MAQQSSSSSDKEKGKVQCISCYKTIDNDHTGIKCMNDCNICPGECSNNFVKQIFEAPENQIPLKCVNCKQQVIVETFERQLNVKQNQIFLLYHMQYDPKFLDNNEIIASCPFCPYWEVNTVDVGRLIYLCQRGGCKKSSCFWCKKQIKNRNNVDAETKVDIDEDELESHFGCAALAPTKAIWDKALSDGNVKPCPKCGVSGMKNNACTHMTCVKCQCQWCYVCGLSFEQQDRDKNIDNYATNLFGHNMNWKKSGKRCPMWLNEISQIDKRWPNDSDAAVTFLHRLRTMQLLKEAIKKIGDQSYKKLCKKYMIDQTCGFDIYEVLNGDHTLIKR